MTTYQQTPNAVIIGCGPSGIALAYKLKSILGFTDFTIYDKLDGPGGTWRTNTYPGCGCDIPSILYSFSFNINPRWSKELVDQPEILEYMNDTMDKYDLRKHLHTEVECLGATWDADLLKWHVKFNDLRTGMEFSRYATIFVSAVGGISFPRDTKFKGMEKFKGPIFHTARWDHTVDYSGKRVAVIGNGCSAAQTIPKVLKKASYVKQYARSAQWFHERPNRPFPEWKKWCFQYLPLYERFVRLRLFLSFDSLVQTYMPGKDAAAVRRKTEAEAVRYMHSMTPKKYHDMMVPDFPLGCKRRIFDPDYLESLNEPHMELVSDHISELDETGIRSTNGIHTNVDVIVLGTGFQVSNFLTPMEIVGANGTSLSKQWRENRGAQAYMGTTIANFPNFAVLFGPNTFPAHNSALFACEVQVDYTARTLFAPILDGRAKVIDVKQTAEDQYVNEIQQQLLGSVFQAGCSNWYLNEFGRNVASWPGFASDFWKKTIFTRFEDYNLLYGTKWWPLNRLKRHIRTTSIKTYICIAASALFFIQRRQGGTLLPFGLADRASGSIQAFLNTNRELIRSETLSI